MSFDSAKPHRHSLRLQKFDYSRAGAYLITICTQGRACLFGDIVEGQMLMNDSGRMVQSTWEEVPAFYGGVETDEFIVMPNHIHGIIVLSGASRPSREGGAASTESEPDVARPDSGHAREPDPTVSLPEVMMRFKSLTTRRYIDGVRQPGWVPFAGRLWQRNYYEHIIRNEESLNRIRQYIVDNPAKWAFDHENRT